MKDLVMPQATRERERERERERDEFELKNGLKLKNSIEIDRFVESLKEIQAKEIIPYDYNKYHCEIADLDRAVDQRNIEDCLLFFTRQENNQFFEIKHPIYNEIKTRAVFSYLKEGNDVIDYYELLFFIDENNKHPWLLLSSLDSFSYMITSTGFFQLAHATMSPLKDDWIYKILKSKDLIFKDITWGYDLRNFTPLHYFYNNLVFFLLTKTNKNILDKPSLFIPKKYMNKRTINEVYIIPKCLPLWLFSGKSSNMGKEVYEEAMQDFDKIVKKEDTQYDLTIWLSLTSTDWGKRWIEQVEGSASIINELLKYFPKIKVYFDGLSSYENSNQITSHSTESSIIEKRFLEEIKNKCDISKINIQSLHKLTIREKICYCSNVDLCINETGSAAIVPSLCCKKPCVFFGNFVYLSMTLLSNPVHYRQVDIQYIKLDPNRKYTRWDGFYPYHIPWQHIYNLAAEILEELSQDGKIKAQNLKMNRLQVPKVELIAKKYDLSIKLKEFEKQFHLDKKAAENEFIAFLADEIMDLKTKISNLNQEKDVAKVRNHLAYRLGAAMIVCSKSFFGLCSLPFVLGFVRAQYKKEQKAHKALITQRSQLQLPEFECIDYQAALKEKECFTYKLGLAFIKACKTWYKGGFVKFYFEAKRLYKEFKKQQKSD